MRKYFQKNGITYALSNGDSFLFKNEKWYSASYRSDKTFYMWERTGEVTINEAFIIYKVIS